ncbi:asparagine--tRNA ligase [Candidatus Photodesmus anomalopis]|uniref:Asparagine--tRNA ligase n=1 Tax=Candidatus Photodesmus katoptron Akat1 TaxID=1236703 RepID=S3E043_9GAMM|nr:asparagine--tRNA ligase [Candidatus Photodesmus katoptron]EPE37581.1 asparaginyl-tRNA synthetase [Candidatus Photodesmus katoptron Akat1]
MNLTPVIDILTGNLAVSSFATVSGWVRSRRDSKAGISFISIYDGSCLSSLQAVVPNTLDNYKSEILKLTSGCSIKVKGEIVESPGKGQHFELSVTEFKVIGWIEKPETYPMAKTRQSMEYLREIAHLRPRSNIIGAVSRVRNALFCSVHNFFQKNGYLWVSTPLITSSDTEGTGEMFRVSTLDIQNLSFKKQGKVDYSKDFFGQETFLTVSGQLNAEAYACALSKVYTFGPTFRAENSNTSRHLSEFWMVEPEVAFAELQDIAHLAEEMLKYIFQDVLQNCSEDLKFFYQNTDKTIISRIEKILDSKFLKIDYTDAVQILQDSNKKFNFSVEWGIDLSSEHERYLTEKYFGAPLIVKNYPKNIKAFYMRLNDDNKTVASMDLLVPGIGEIIGGSQREERLDILNANMIKIGIKPEQMNWYRDLRRYGTVPHSGFGLGFERLVSYVTGVKNVRDVIPFPRTPLSAKF